MMNLPKMTRLASWALLGCVMAASPILWGQTPMANPNASVSAARLSDRAPLLLADKPINDPTRPLIPRGMRRYVVTLADSTNQDACAATHRITRERSFKHPLNGFVLISFIH